MPCEKKKNLTNLERSNNGQKCDRRAQRAIDEARVRKAKHRNEKIIIKNKLCALRTPPNTPIPTRIPLCACASASICLSLRVHSIHVLILKAQTMARKKNAKKKQKAERREKNEERKNLFLRAIWSLGALKKFTENSEEGIFVIFFFCDGKDKRKKTEWQVTEV